MRDLSCAAKDLCMTTIFNLRAATNATFHWTRDFSQVASAYPVAAGVIRMQARTTPAAVDPPAYQWLTGASSGGVITFDPLTNLCVFAAPESDMAAMHGPLVYDVRLELPGGECVSLFSGRIVWTPGVTRTASDATAQTGVSSLGDTVSVDGEAATSPVPLPLELSAALTAAQASATAAAGSAATAQANIAFTYSGSEIDAKDAATLASAGIAATAALAGAMRPAALGAALAAWFATLPKSMPATDGQWWNDGGTPAQS
jgi:hypothetical protein